MAGKAFSSHSAGIKQHTCISQKYNVQVVLYLYTISLFVIFLTSCTFSSSVKNGWNNVSNSPQQTERSPQLKSVEIQRLLTDAGYHPGPVDGIAGPKTARALRSFQYDHGIAVTGKPDKETCALLAAYTDKTDVAHSTSQKKNDGLRAEKKAKAVTASGEPAQPGTGESSSSGATSALKAGGSVVSTVGTTLDDMGEERKGSFIGSQLSLAGKIYKSIGNTIETGADELEEGKEISFTEANRRAAVGVGGAINEWADDSSQGRQEIVQAQEKLVQLGFYSGSVDGVLGPETRQAIRNYQESSGLTVTGELDGGTLQALRNDD